jgi:hypothetical protein
MSDALTGLTEVTNASNAKIANLVQSYLVQEAKLLGKITDYSSLATPGSKSVAIPRSGGFTVAQKSENTAVTAQIVTYASDAIVFGEPHCVQFVLEDTASIQAAMDLKSDMLLKAAKDMALYFDTTLIAAMVAGAASSNPDHQIVFTDTSTDVMAIADVLAMRKLIEAQYIDPSECYLGIGPEKECELLNISGFQNAANYGNGAPLASGVIGSIFGTKVVLHAGFADRAVMWHPSSFGHAFQQNVIVKEQADLANVGTRYGLQAFWACKVLDSGKRLVHCDSTN